MDTLQAERLTDLVAEGCNCDWSYEGDPRAGEPGMVLSKCRRCRALEEAAE
jgi:hypothetical protein